MTGVQTCALPICTGGDAGHEAEVAAAAPHDLGHEASVGGRGGLLGLEQSYTVWVILAALGSLAFLHHAVLGLWVGSRETRPWLVAGSALLLTAWVFVRFGDLFENLLARGAAFLVLSGALFFIAAMYHRQRREAAAGRNAS